MSDTAVYPSAWFGIVFCLGQVWVAGGAMSTPKHVRRALPGR
jgi:hypothetical protein